MCSFFYRLNIFFSNILRQLPNFQCYKKDCCIGIWLCKFYKFWKLYKKLSAKRCIWNNILINKLTNLNRSIRKNIDHIKQCIYATIVYYCYFLLHYITYIKYKYCYIKYIPSLCGLLSTINQWNSEQLLIECKCIVKQKKCYSVKWQCIFKHNLFDKLHKIVLNF